jgi:pimeloyl-ACP methyl ester carboxylesterase
MVIEDAGHVLPMEAPEKFNAIVMTFLEKMGGYSQATTKTV